VELDDELTQDPTRVLNSVVRLDDEHPRVPGLYAVRFIVEERLTTKAIRCRVEYQLGLWEWYKRNSDRWMDDEKYDQEVRGIARAAQVSIDRSWDHETTMALLMIPVAIATRVVLHYLL
jgi:hypothetical protein